MSFLCILISFPVPQNHVRPLSICTAESVVLVSSFYVFIKCAFIRDSPSWKRQRTTKRSELQDCCMFGCFAGETNCLTLFLFIIYIFTSSMNFLNCLFSLPLPFLSALMYLLYRNQKADVARASVIIFGIFQVFCWSLFASLFFF